LMDTPFCTPSCLPALWFCISFQCHYTGHNIYTITILGSKTIRIRHRWSMRPYQHPKSRSRPKCCNRSSFIENCTLRAVGGTYGSIYFCTLHVIMCNLIQ
jgi:hypothetical protein